MDITVERLFNLGDYKNLKVIVSPSDLSDPARYNVEFNLICDAYQTFFINQIVGCRLNGTSTESWEQLLEKLYEIRKTGIVEEN